MANDIYKFRVYSIRTPKYMERKDIEVKGSRIIKSHFEYEVIDHFFEGLQYVDDIYKEFKVKLNYINDTCQITFIKFINLDEEFSCFVLETDRFGNEKTIKDNKNKKRDKKLESHESVPEVIRIYIQKKHGILFVSKDYNTIINKTTLNTFFNHFRFVLYEYINQYNKHNKDSNYKIYKQPAIKVDSLPSMDFFDELDTLRSVKLFSYSYNPTGAEDTPNFNDIDELKDAGFKREELKETRIFEDVRNKSDLKKVKKLYQVLEEKRNFDNYYVEGISNSGKEKIVKPDFSTRSINIKFNSNEEVNDKKIVIRLKEYLKVDNILSSKIYRLTEVSEPDFSFNSDIIEDINKKIKEEYGDMDVRDDEEAE